MMAVDCCDRCDRMKYEYRDQPDQTPILTEVLYMTHVYQEEVVDWLIWSN